MTELSVIIVSFNVRRFLENCLKSLVQEAEKDKNLEIEVVVVDNASNDGSLEMIRRNWKYHGSKLKIKLIENKKNLGFAKAANQGVKISHGKYILLLNPDIIVKPGALITMLNFAKSNPLTGAIGGKLLDPNGKVQGSCYFLPTLGRAFKQLISGKIDFFSKYSPAGESPVGVEAVTGGSFLIPRKIVQKVGLLDERFFMYFEDLDYCQRVKKAGFQILYLPTARFIHFHGQSGKANPYNAHRFLVESSKIYHGQAKYWLITILLWASQKVRRISE